MINLIGLSGYAFSGKSTVGSIIQYLTSESSQKRTYEEFLSKGQGNNDFQTWYNSDWEIKGFATKLKKIASLLTGIPEHKFDDPEFKKSFLPKEWNVHEFVGKGGGSAVLPKYGGEIKERQMSVREFLQKLGTDAVRNVLGEDVWVNALFADYNPKPRIKDIYFTNEDFINDTFTIEGEMADKWIVTDCRFPNEAHAIKDRGGIMIRINRMKSVSLEEGPYLHISERALDDWSFDYEINNNVDGIENLIPKVKEMLRHFEIIT